MRSRAMSSLIRSNENQVTLALKIVLRLQYLLSSLNFVRLLQGRPRQVVLTSQLVVMAMESDALIMQGKMIKNVASVLK